MLWAQAEVDVVSGLVNVIAGLLCILVIATPIGAIILRAGCWLYNKLYRKFAGGPDAASPVPDPGFGKAVAIAFVPTLVVCLVNLLNFILAFLSGSVEAVQELHPAVLPLVSLPVGFFVLAWMTRIVLPTDFVRGILIALMSLVVAMCVGLLIGVVVMAIVAIAG
jgi:hypothetical protein